MPVPRLVTRLASYHSSPGRSTSRTAWIALGANLGPAEATLRRALRGLDAVPGVRVVAVSPLVTTAPEGPPQPPYLNAVARVRTTLSPRALLGALHALERAAGRHRAERWGPRTLDLDLLLYEDRCIETPILALPHPRMHIRRFVLEPLAVLDPTVTHPRLDRPVGDLLEALGRCGTPD